MKLPIKNKYNYIVFCMFLILMLIISIVISTLVGSVNIKSGWIFKIIANNLLKYNLFETVWPASVNSIIWDLRLPRILLAFLVGAGLSVSGIAMQALTKNSLADPYILGISSGASTGAVAAILLGVFGSFSGYSVPFGAFLGAMISIVIVFNIANFKRRSTPTRLVLTGVAISALFSSVTNLMVFTVNDENKVRSALFWMEGSLGGTKWEYIPVTFFVFALCSLVIYIFSKPLDAIMLGDDIATTIGVDTKSLKIVVIVVTTLLTGAIVSVSGVIGFIGLVIPHISRSIVGSEHKRIIPVSILIGGIFTIWADVCARIVVSPEELPIGIVTSFIGVPFFLWLLRKSDYLSGGNNR